MKKTYQPSNNTLKKYADVMVNYALWGGTGIKKGDVVLLRAWESAKPLYVEIRNEILRKGGHVISMYTPEDTTRDFFEIADDNQLSFFPEKYFKGLIDQIDHYIIVISENNKQELKGIPPEKMMLTNKAMKPWFDWRSEKENANKFTWTLCLYGTEAMAKESGLSLESYWDQISKACFLEEKDPVAKWRDTQNAIESIKQKLNSLKIHELHIKSEKTDLVVGLDENREWLGGSGRNIPSFEVFISPDWRRTNGHIYFNQPLYSYGNLLQDVYLEFENGVVTKATAKEGESVLKEMLKVEGANKIGEFSLTDSRHSHITKFMAETLFDENMGGKYGNTHLALGKAYEDSYPDKSALPNITKEQWADMGYNTSSVHTDIISTENRVVTATLTNGEKQVIYRDGKFTF